jgi:hypothetical protein
MAPKGWAHARRADLPEFPIEVYAQPWTTGLTARCMRRLFTDEKSRAVIVTCRKVEAELVERWALTWAQVDRL